MSFPRFQRAMNVSAPEEQPTVAVNTFGAVGDGVEDDTARIQSAIDRASSQGSALGLVRGTYRITAPLEIPSGLKFLGYGGKIQLDSGANFAALDLDGVSDVCLVGLILECLGAPQGSCRGVLIRGNSNRIIVKECQSSGMGSNFAIRGEEGTVAGTVEDVLFEACKGDGALQTYGFECSNSNGVLYKNCFAEENYLDGFKFRALTENTELVDCVARANGQSPTSAGDGLDAYAGGDSFTVRGFVAVDNQGNGMTIKTDILTLDDPSTFGYVRNIQLDSCIIRGNRYGIYLATNTQSVNQFNDNPPAYDQANLPQPKYCTISNCQIEDNAFQGIYCNMVGVTMHGGIYRRNGYDGIQVGLRALYVTMHSPIFVSNGRDVDDSGYNLYIRGNHVIVYSPQFFGVDPDIVRTEADLTGSPTAIANCAVAGQCDDCEIVYPVEDPTSEGTITTALTSGAIRFHFRGTGSPEGNYRGAIGSTYEQLDASEGRIARWMKVSGTPASPNGWAPFTPGNIDDANSSYGDWAFGSLAQNLSGISILCDPDGLAGMSFCGASGQLTGAVEYDLDSSGADTMYFRTDLIRRLRLNSAAFFPDENDAISFGVNGLRPFRTFTLGFCGEFEDSPAALDRSWFALMNDGETVALPSSPGRRGATYIIEHEGTGAAATIGRPGSETINGAASNFSLNAGEMAICVSDGVSDWRVKVIGS